MSNPADILQFWFQSLTDETPIDKRKPPASSWFTKSRRFDEEIHQNFGGLWQEAKAGGLKDWEKTSRGMLALVILFDQFPRNMFRNSPQAFETDALALELTKRSIKEGTDRELALIERVFLYMPFMHSEAISVQEEGIHAFESLVEDSKKKSSPNTAYFEYNLLYAKRHREIIAKFGRFPHRNAVLNRSVTPQEAEFLSKPGSSF